MTVQRTLATLLAAAAAALIVSHTVVGAATKPNVVVVLTDDLEMVTFNTMLNGGLLPNIKQRLIDHGFLFDNSFVADATCCPSRATFLTGQYPHNHNVLTNFTPNGSVTAFNDTSTLATWLQAAGYRTGLAGKYLNGYGGAAASNPPTSPLNPAYVPPGWTSWQALVDVGAATPFDYMVSDNGVVTDHRPFDEVPLNYHTDMMMLRGLLFIYDSLTNHPGQPFFVVQAPISPHFHNVDRDHSTIYDECPTPGGQRAPFDSGNLFGMTPVPAARHRDTIFGNLAAFPLPHPPSFNEADVSGKAPWIQSRLPLDDTDQGCLQKQYWRRMEAMRAIDDWIGIEYSFLEQTGAAANTVFMLASDNGYHLGEHRLTEKSSPYEEAIRVPLAIRVPWNTAARHVSQVVTNADWAPTIAALAGASPTLTVDGRSLAPVLTNQTATFARNAFLVEHHAGGLDTAGSGDLGDYPVPEPYFAVRVANPPRKYVLYNSGFREYYDLAADPYELVNLASDPTRETEIELLDEELDTLKTCKGFGCWIAETLFTLDSGSSRRR